MKLSMFLLTTTMVAMVGCAAEPAGDDYDETTAELSSLQPGVNSKGCRRSAYNCGLHPGVSSQRVTRADGPEDWAVAASFVGKVPVVDGNGDPMGTSKRTSFTMNYGQTRRMNDRTWVIALSTGLGAAGWVPIDVFEHEGSLRERVGEVNAHGSALADLSCYEVRSTYDSELDDYKVVKHAKVSDSEEPNDYLPMKRANGKVYANLAFSVPGDALGAPAIDIFPAGTLFQRLDVPTWESDSPPSLDVKLYSQTKGTYRFDDLASRRMKFLYGYVKTKSGDIRYGWMPQDGLTSSDKKCPNR